MNKFAVGVLLLSSCAVSMAQTTLDGPWKATFSTGGSEPRTADIVVSGGAGTWTTLARPNKDKNDPCIGRAFPIAVTNAAGGQVTIELRASKELSGCKDRTATLQRLPSGALEGKLDNGSEIRLTG